MRLYGSRESALSEALEGLILANPGKYERLDTQYGYGIYRKNLPQNQVRVIINGGGGYGPMWLGFADEHLADAMVQGEFDSAPNAYVLYEMAKEIECGNGVLFLCNHFMGDYLNNDMAVELLLRDGIEAKACYITDDMLSCQGEPKENRGGLHGIGQICKIVSRAARDKRKLNDIYALAEKGNERIRSISVNIRDEKMFFGEGFSGEPAVSEEKYESLKDLVRKSSNIVLNELDVGCGDKLYLSLNIHNMVSYSEGFAMLNFFSAYIKSLGLELCGCGVGTYFDVFQGVGCMISLLSCDEEMQNYVSPAEGCGFRV